MSDSRPRKGAAKPAAAVKRGRQAAEAQAAPRTIYRLHVELRDIAPRIWRQLLVPSWATLAKLHEVLQISLGWTNSHLHQFHIAGATYGMPDDEWREVSPLDDRRYTVAGCLADRVPDFVYEYDFGDGWEHAIHVEAILPVDQVDHYPLCTGGANACPPEDVGGSAGYFDFLQVIRDPSHEEHRDMLRWCGGSFDPTAFDRNAVNARLRRLKIPAKV
jgi:hypothetical protein